MTQDHGIGQIDMDKADYEAPTVTRMSDEEVLRMFQITASEIGAAAVWWAASCC